MKDCNGVLGRWFGHRFRSLLMHREPAGRITMRTTGGFGPSPEEIADAYCEKTYEIRCTRCGEKPDD